MATYTTTVRSICESLAIDEVGEDYTIDGLLMVAEPKLFDFYYPFVLDDQYRSALQTKILKHYFTREIGFETVALWKLKLNVKLNEIMPYYNQLYESAQLEFDPFHDVDITKDYTLDNITSVKGKMTRRESDTPQGGLNGLESNEYMSFGSITDNSGTDTRGDTYHETVKGKNGTDSYSKRLMEYRKTFLNIDMMVINELEELFMQIW